MYKNFGTTDDVKNYDKVKRPHSSSVQKLTALEHQINDKMGTEKLLKGNKE